MGRPESRSEPTIMKRMVTAAVDYLHECHDRTVELTEIAARAGVPMDSAREVFADDDALDEAIGTYGILQLSDVVTRALVAVPQGDPRASLIALATAYLTWAQANRKLYYVLTTQLVQPRRTDSVIRLYDASFVPLVRRFLGEQDPARATRRAAMARSFLFGLTDLALEDHLDLWLLPNEDTQAELIATIEDFVTLILAAPAPGDQPMRSEA